jgi:cyclohexanone monooxygenase
MTVTLPISGVTVNVDFDPAEIDTRYAEERRVRIKPEGIGQFNGLGDVLEYTDRDFYSTRIVRPAVEEDVEVIVLGGGFGGILAGAHLGDRGFDDIRIVEQAGDFGGTWYWNRYPGVQCDIESYIYLPLLEETGYIPNQRFSDGDEILEHAQRIARHYDLYRSAMFHTTVTAAIWLPEASVGGSHRSWRPASRKVPGSRERAAEQAATPPDPGDPRFRRSDISHQPLGLRLHRR